MDRVLGTLIEEEGQHDKALISTLEAFFTHQRSWQKTADALHVHRQTGCSCSPVLVLGRALQARLLSARPWYAARS